MSEFTPDLDAYCERIGYRGPRTPDLATLRALHLHHVSAVPFENLDVLLGRRVSLDPAVIADKIILRRRGGYCFEQNTLFRVVLTALGFHVTPLLARVRWQVPADVGTPLTHTVLRVDLDGRGWLVDVGFGAVGATAPLALDATEPQATSHDTRRLVPQADGLVHQVRHGDAWGDVYRFSLVPPPPVDFEVGNWFSCTHPRAHFTNNLVVTRVRGAERLIILNREFAVRHADGSATRRDIATPHDLRALLIEHFGLHLSSDARLAIPAAPW
ncbi:MAG: arylamine N-acetyltransferase [Opitutaceae bacterium]|nr:arylamine N-acetyltransferase [Opitutaceae bacterium]